MTLVGLQTALRRPVVIDRYLHRIKSKINSLTKKLRDAYGTAVTLLNIGVANVSQ